MRKTILWFILSVLFISACQDPVSPSISVSEPDTTVVIVKDICGDGILTGKEVCEGNLFNTSKDCRTYGFDSGDVTCTPSCTLDFSTCTKTVEKEDPNKEKEDPNKEKEDPNKEEKLCGNHTPDSGEDCDTDSPLGPCTQFGEEYMDGYVYCSNSCKYDFTQCIKKPVCGNGEREGSDEQCDTSDSLGHCSTWGDYDTGEVFCSNTCKIDKSQCKKSPVCGNGAKEDGEECDDGNKVNTDSCTNNCTLPKCGDGILSDKEICDGNLLPFTSCSEYNPNFDMGSITCTSTCTLNTDNCAVSPKCGDGVINSSKEECEVGLNLTASCTDIYEMATGNPFCNNCKVDYSNCVESCPMNRTFMDGLYTDTSNSGVSIKSVTDIDGTIYITYKNTSGNKIGKVVGPKLIRWISNYNNNEGFYSYFETNCGCTTCDITLDLDAYPTKQEAINDTSHTTSRYTYTTLNNNSVPRVPLGGISIPKELRTEFKYGSCNDIFYIGRNNDGTRYYEDACDSTHVYYTVTYEKITISTTSFTWVFSLIEELGDNLYLIRYNSGSGLPTEINGIDSDHPYAIVKITKGEAYTICDWDNARDINIEFQSWSSYKDTAKVVPEYSSSLKLTYRPKVKYSQVSCDLDNQPIDIDLTTKENNGLDVFYTSMSSFFKYNNRCDDVLNMSKMIQVGFEAEFSGVGTSSSSRWYRSLYRNNVIVFDLDMDKARARFNLEYPEDSSRDRGMSSNVSRVEIEFSDPTDIDTMYSCTTNCHFGYSTKYNLTLKELKSTDIKLCEISTDGDRSCIDVVPWFSNNLTKYYSSSGYCVPRYH